MKNYLIIGGSSGIGYSSAKLLANNGHHVFASYNSSLPSNHDSGINYFKYNVLNDDNAFDKLPGHLDGLVYCPGAINLKPFHRITPD
ncbi:MAG TPA: hypothetical protein VLA03_09290, partial [Draconibacterium sp.]|nr:hypothetical protein [Draconibacterium sp.]